MPTAATKPRAFRRTAPPGTIDRKSRCESLWFPSNSNLVQPGNVVQVGPERASLRIARQHESYLLSGQLTEAAWGATSFSDRIKPANHERVSAAPVDSRAAEQCECSSSRCPHTGRVTKAVGDRSVDLLRFLG